MASHWAKAHPASVMPADLEAALKRKQFAEGTLEGASETEMLLKFSWK
jgi:hypothetical protein